jgi:hypothetical protein
MRFVFDRTTMLGLDGATVVAYRTADEEPTWCVNAGAPTVAVAVALAGPYGMVLTIDGAVQWFESASGRPVSRGQAPAYPLDLAANASGGVAVIAERGITLIDGAGVRSIAAPAPLTTAAFGADGSVLAAGDRAGNVHLLAVHAANGGAPTWFATVALPVPAPAPVAGITAAGPQRWLVTAGDSVFDLRTTTDGLRSYAPVPSATRLTGLSGMTLGAIVADAQVGVFGIQLAPQRAVFLDLQTLDTRLSATYSERLVTGLGVVGVVGDLGFCIGLDLGDANRFNGAGQTCRTEPHPGRPRNRWILSVGR